MHALSMPMTHWKPGECTGREKITQCLQQFGLTATRKVRTKPCQITWTPGISLQAGVVLVRCTLCSYTTRPAYLSITWWLHKDSHGEVLDCTIGNVGHVLCRLPTGQHHVVGCVQLPMQQVCLQNPVAATGD